MPVKTHLRIRKLPAKIFEIEKEKKWKVQQSVRKKQELKPGNHRNVLKV